jgi:hypothetical protein
VFLSCILVFLITDDISFSVSFDSEWSKVLLICHKKEQILYQKSWANKCECPSYSVMPDLRKLIALFDVFQDFPACSSYKSDIMVETSVKPQNDRMPMWQVI